LVYLDCRHLTEDGMTTDAKICCSIREASELTGLGKTTLYALLSEGKITGVRVGTRRLLHVASLRQLLEAA
jgi:excisionase family DNA binding protein